MFPEKTHCNENVALVEKIDDTADKENLLYLFDKGVHGIKHYRHIKNDLDCFFISKLYNQTYEIIGSVSKPKTIDKKYKILYDSIIHFKNTRREIKDEFRVVKVIPLDKNNNEIAKYNKKTKKDETVVITFITNILDLDAETIADIYRSRWEIELFFKMLKSFLNFCHLTSRTENGILVMLYCYLIFAILLILYRKNSQEPIVNWTVAKRELDYLLKQHLFKGG